MRLNLLIGLLGIGFNATAHVDNLPDCPLAICETIVTNEDRMEGTLIVWTGDTDILNSYTFKLKDKSSLQDINTEIKKINISAWNWNKDDNPPPTAPCKSGACAAALQGTIKTISQIVGLTVSFVYFDGDLVSVSTATNEQPLNDQTKMQ
ncbi:hypothetical protein [Shewanella sp.]|uniref:hypothetical protein n=1 Tax=Shewanella sp. TaxID=50422 RepID=UPI003F39FE6E